MRIALTGQAAFGASSLEALLKEGELVMPSRIRRILPAR